MLAKKYRLSGFLVSQLFKKGKHLESSLFTLKTFSLKKLVGESSNCPHDSLPTTHSLFSVVVSLKVEKKAVKRNRLRRQLYEILRLNLEKIKAGLAIIIVVKKQALDKNYGQLEKELIKLFMENNLLKTS